MEFDGKQISEYEANNTIIFKKEFKNRLNSAWDYNAPTI
jgi:hypothetical protein